MNGESEHLSIEAGKTHSLWIETTEETNFPSLTKDVKVDTVIIGGGIAGLTTALLLKDQGREVAVIEAAKIVKDTTGHTTAKVTALHGFVYQSLLVKFGFLGARAYVKASFAAIEKIASIVETKNIDCDFKRTIAYSYTEEEKNMALVNHEYESSIKLGLDSFYTEKPPLPFPVKAAIGLRNQAQFHPRKYLLGVAKEIASKGGHIFENTKALEISEDKHLIIKTDRGEIRTKNAVIATHFPFVDKGFFYARLYPYRSYAIACQIEEELPEGIYYSQDENHHSIRNYSDNGNSFLIVGGGRHRSGQSADTLKNYNDVLNYAKIHFNLKSIGYYWSAQDYHTADGVPYIGKLPGSKKIYVACGMGAWGMTNATAAAKIIANAIMGRTKSYAHLFKPSRINLVKGGSTILKENTSDIKQYLKGYFSKTKTPICPHMGCRVTWNTAEETWDCPCHGSRFDKDGRVIHGPALSDLPEIK